MHSHATVGADGFGFSWRHGSWRKLPHVGGVVIGDDVEVGANTTVDRAAFGTTRVAAGTKLDNLVQVGHGASIGAHSLICAQSGIAGSAVLGARVKLGGQAAVGDRTVLGE